MTNNYDVEMGLFLIPALGRHDCYLLLLEMCVRKMLKFVMIKNGSMYDILAVYTMVEINLTQALTRPKTENSNQYFRVKKKF